jgi:hypothetical protein
VKSMSAGTFSKLLTSALRLCCATSQEGGLADELLERKSRCLSTEREYDG